MSPRTDATPTFVTALGNGSDGEAIAFNPDDGLIYHWSGIDDDLLNDPESHQQAPSEAASLAITE
ncbi:MAG: hypothetical protein AB4426_12405 [Xenococcaceae cyanobacterium]